MKVSQSMKEIWEIKEKTGLELEGKTDEEILAYFQEREPKWAKSLPRRGPTDSVSPKKKASTP